MTFGRLRLWATAALSAGLAFSPAAPAAAKDLIMKVGVAPGALGDTAARLVARHIGRFLPGNPTVIVQNEASAGGLVLLRLLQNSEPNDGSVIGAIALGNIVSTVLDPGRTGIEPNGFKWVGALTEEPGICIVRSDAGVKTMQEFLARPLKLGSTTKTAIAYIEAALIKNLFGAKYEVVTGFSGAPEMNLALTRGELDGACGMNMYSFLRTDFARDKTIIGYIGPAPKEEFTSLKPPAFADLVKNERDMRAFRLVTSVKYASHPLALPPTTPDSIVETFRVAYNRMVADPDFRRDAEKLIPDLVPHTGAEVASFVAEIAAADKDVLARARELVQ